MESGRLSDGYDGWRLEVRWVGRYEEEDESG